MRPDLLFHSCLATTTVHSYSCSILLPLAAGALDMKAITMLHFFVGEMHSLRVCNGD